MACFFLSNYIDALDDNYYNMPWEYQADLLGGVNRGYSSWAQEVHEIYVIFWYLI